MAGKTDKQIAEEEGLTRNGVFLATKRLQPQLLTALRRADYDLVKAVRKMVEFAEKYHKKVVIEGRSLKQNIEVCKHLGLLKADKNTIISTDDMDNYPPDRIVILATGAQGDDATHDRCIRVAIATDADGLTKRLHETV